MEYVAGEPITSYCDRNRLSVQQRLELFIAVCEAVQHAHQKAIIHRDIKPSNVLVSDRRPARRPRREGDRLRRRQGRQPHADRQDAVHRARPDHRHAGVHEPRAGGDGRAGHRHAHGRVLAGRGAVRAADRRAAVRAARPAQPAATTRSSGSSARSSRRGRALGCARWRTASAEIARAAADAASRSWKASFAASWSGSRSRRCARTATSATPRRIELADDIRNYLAGPPADRRAGIGSRTVQQVRVAQPLAGGRRGDGRDGADRRRRSSRRSASSAPPATREPAPPVPPRRKARRNAPSEADACGR